MELGTRIKNYWEGEAEGYSRGIEDELRGFQRGAWTDLILENAPAPEHMDILDIGTGPGFFPIIMSDQGHAVTGIDLTENMIAFARRNLEREKATATLLTMDCQNLTFADESFDLVLCRNLTWTLDNPVRAYGEWHRVLRPGGRLLVFDACWYLHLFDEEKTAAYRKKEQETLEKYGRPLHNHKDQKEGDAISKKLFMSDKIRPQWDLERMLELGFSKVFADVSIGNRTQGEQERDRYSLTPPFLVGGEK